jgi:thymidylate kinase
VVSASEGLARVNARGGESEPVFENLEFLERVSRVFETLDVAGLERIDASRGEEEIAGDVVAVLDRVVDPSSEVAGSESS